MLSKRLGILIVFALCAEHSLADRLVFGSFRSSENANNWAAKLTASFATSISAVAVESEGATLYRVYSVDLDEAQFQRLKRRADSAGVRHWRLRNEVLQSDSASRARPQPPLGGARLVPPNPVDSAPIEPPESPAVQNDSAVSDADPSPDKVQEQAPSSVSVPVARTTTAQRRTAARVDWDVALQSRAFSHAGLDDQKRLEASASVELEYHRGWDNDTQSFTFSPFLRLDSADSERSHGDLREFFYSRIGDDWDLHIGAKRVFWGVTEFNHLVDIINQTDLVENIDHEDKLGQPMVHLSLVRDWGIVDVYALTGFRERTFAGQDGRLSSPFPILDSVDYESGAQDKRTDMALRWSHYMGPFEIGVHHFSGTSREPMLQAQFAPSGSLVLKPYYPVIDQTGLDAQAFYGDLAIKLEAFTRSGFGQRYAAFNFGFEQTFVGVFGSQADLGLVGEYLFDERGDDAFNSFYENDIALGGRLHLNNFSDTKALLGVITDADSQEYFVSLEASTRLADDWLLSIEGRLFGGGEGLTSTNSILTLTDPDYKSAWLADEDYLQLEVKKFF